MDRSDIRKAIAYLELVLAHEDDILWPAEERDVQSVINMLRGKL